jgi:hypothetical protein
VISIGGLLPSRAWISKALPGNRRIMPGCDRMRVEGRFP